MPEQLEIEFTIEPFVPARPGRHVTAAIDAARDVGLEVTIGPFGTRATGARDDVLAGADRIIREALTNGATRVSLQIVRPTT
jgi:uncharacterized protein YqgV (UPF0045/DUF77 family)